MHDSSPNDDLSLSATSPTPSNGVAEKLSLNSLNDDAYPSDSVGDGSPESSKKATTSHDKKLALRAVKKEICDRVCEDWTWPLTHSEWEASQRELDDTKEWRGRESDSDYSPSSPVLHSDPYRFDSPDSVPPPVLSKSRKRRRLLEEEMQWNEGLRIFNERRNAWSGARIQPATPPPADGAPSSQRPTTTAETSYLPTPPSPTHDPRPSSPTPPPTTLIPLAPPILPLSNPIRSSIHPRTYLSIYDKIILRGLSPTIPINLKDIVRAIVAGWKKDGEWPPKSEAEKVGAMAEDRGGKGEGRRLARRGVGRVKRALGLGRGVDGMGRGEGG